MIDLAALPERYRLILCDLWGVVHDGYTMFPGVAERLAQWRREGRFVLFLTNAPRTIDVVESHLDELGVPRECWDAVVSGGEAGISRLAAIGKPVGFIGTRSDRKVLEGREVVIADDGGFSDLAVTGVERGRPRVEDYRDQLAALAQRGVHFHCLNPDRLVIHGGEPMICAGALADMYEALGGSATWYGKPYAPIYQHALKVAGITEDAAVLAIGDNLETDMLGAARMGFDAVYVTGGIAEGAGFPTDFADRRGLGDWRPVAVVQTIG